MPEKEKGNTGLILAGMAGLGLIGYGLLKAKPSTPPPLGYYNLAITASGIGNGSTIPAIGTHTYKKGTVVTIKAIPATGQQFVKWGGDITSDQATITVAMDTNKWVVAFFAPAGSPIGEITGVWINKAPEGNKLPVGDYDHPLYVVADSANSFEVGIKYKNLSGFTAYGGVKIKVWDPQDIVRVDSAIDWTGMSDNEELSVEIQGPEVDIPGDWYAKISFLMNKNSPNETNAVTVDIVNVRLFVAKEGEEPPPPPPPSEEGFSNLIIERGTSDYYAIVSIGSKCRVNMTFDYKGPEVTRAVIRAALWIWSWFDPHNEIAWAEVSMYIPATPTKATYAVYLDIPIHSGMDLRTYGLYCKITNIAGADIYSPFYPDAVLVIA